MSKIIGIDLGALLWWRRRQGPRGKPVSKAIGIEQVSKATGIEQVSKTIGIDLGTYNSAASFASERTVTMVNSRHGKTRYGKNFPSFVLFDYDGKKQLVGKPAQEAGSRDPKLLVWGVKRLVGLPYETAERNGELERFPYDIQQGPGGSILIKVGGESYTPDHILEFILRDIKESAENTRVNPIIGSGINEVVVSVPAYFDGPRTGHIEDAAKMAGFARVRTIAEPTAAAMWYIFKTGRKFERDTKILVFDLGAGTLDVSIMLLVPQQEGNPLSGVLSTHGDPALGGIDMDDALTQYLCDKYKRQDILQDRRKSLMFRGEEVEKAKIGLSSREKVPVYFPGAQTEYLTRKELEQVLRTLLDKCQGVIRIALEKAPLKANELDLVLFVGGPTYMPCVRATVKSELAKLGARKEVLSELPTGDYTGPPVFDPMECVAGGACLKASGLMVPDVENDPNGYGTILGPVPGLPDYYYSIIPPNSSYPTIPKSKAIVFQNPRALRVPIELVRKTPRDHGGHTEYEYVQLGNYDCYIRSTGEAPEIDITMELTDNKRLVTTFTHTQTRESVRLVGLNNMNGNEVKLQEDTPPPHHPPPPPGPTGKPKRVWTQEQYERVKHVAQGLVDEFPDGKNAEVTEKKAELCRLIRVVGDPDMNTAPIICCVLELLNALWNAKAISEEDNNRRAEELRDIERAA